jgi:dTDP-4-dehydrorhamnose reductase
MVLVTGAAGMVGSHLLEAYPEEEIHRTDLHPDPEAGIHPLDVRDHDQVMDTVERVKPTRVLHLAAETDVDRCEKEPDHAFCTNTLGTQNVALACQRFGVELVYVSTAGVFDGSKPDSYTEFDAPAPVNVYARAKWEGEKLAASLTPRHYIVRAGWMFGGRGKDKKFVGKIAALMCTQGELRVVNDKFGSPTYAKDLLANIRVLTARGFYGLYHVAGTGAASRYEVAQEIARYLEKDVRIVPIPSAAFPLPAPRPRSEATRNYKLELLGLNRMRHWKEALHEYLRPLASSS